MSQVVVLLVTIGASSSSSSSDFLLRCRYRGHIHNSGPPSGQLACSTHGRSHTRSPGVPLCQLLPSHLGPPRPTLSINLYVKGCLDCTVGAFHMSIPAEPSLFQYEVQVFNSADLSDHCSVISLQTQEAELCYWPKKRFCHNDKVFFFLHTIISQCCTCDNGDKKSDFVMMTKSFFYPIKST